MKDAFESGAELLRKRQNMRQSGRESLCYIYGWLLRALLKAAKQQEKEFREQLHVLVARATFSREVAIKDRNIPTAKVERVELFGGLNYANGDLYSFVERLEFVFKHALTPELLVMILFIKL